MAAARHSVEQPDHLDRLLGKAGAATGCESRHIARQDAEPKHLAAYHAGEALGLRDGTITEAARRWTAMIVAILEG
jgi:hypothetical protein